MVVCTVAETVELRVEWMVAEKVVQMAGQLVDLWVPSKVER